MADAPPYPGTPGWVKVFGTIVAVLVLLLVVLKLTGVSGDHGPGRHNPPPSVNEDRAPPGGGHTQPRGRH